MNPITMVYLCFYESVLSFTHVNLLLQTEDPSIYLITDAVRVFLKKLLSKYVTIQAIKNCDDNTQVQFKGKANQLDDSNLTDGILTKECLSKLLEDGDISFNQ